MVINLSLPAKSCSSIPNRSLYVLTNHGHSAVKGNFLTCNTHCDTGHPFLWSYLRTRDIHTCSRYYIWLTYFPHQTYNVLSYDLLKRVPVVVVVAARLLTKCQKFHRGRKEAACDSTPDVLVMCSVSYVSPATVLRIQRQPWDDRASPICPSYGRFNTWLTGPPGGVNLKVRTIVNLPFGCLDRDANDRANFAAKIEKVVCIKAARLRTEVL